MSTSSFSYAPDYDKAYEEQQKLAYEKMKKSEKRRVDREAKGPVHADEPGYRNPIYGWNHLDHRYGMMMHSGGYLPVEQDQGTYTEEEIETAG